MTDEHNGNNPADNANTQPPLPSPAPMPPKQSEVGETSNDDSTKKQGVASELAREFKWVEFAQIGSNVVLAIVGIIALCIYNGQLTQMRKATDAAMQSAKVAADTCHGDYHCDKE